MTVFVLEEPGVPMGMTVSRSTCIARYVVRMHTCKCGRLAGPYDAQTQTLMRGLVITHAQYARCTWSHKFSCCEEHSVARSKQAPSDSHAYDDDTCNRVAALCHVGR